MNARTRTLRNRRSTQDSDVDTAHKRPHRYVLERLHRLGDDLRGVVPERLQPWLETGVALGALRSGARLAARVARRNPVLAIAAVAGAGLLLYAAHRQARRPQAGQATGRSREVVARRPGRATDTAGDGATRAADATSRAATSARRARAAPRKRRTRASTAQ